MPGGFQAKPILNLALLPVDRRKFRGQRWERGILRGNRDLQNHPGWVARPIEDIVDVEDSFLMYAVLGEDGAKSRMVCGQQVPSDFGGVGTVHENRELAGDRLFHGADLQRETLPNFIQEGSHCPLTTR